jgi:hypothetical protein
MRAPAVTDAGRAALHDSEESAIQALVTALMSLSAADRATLASAEPALIALAERLRDAERSDP